MGVMASAPESCELRAQSMCTLSGPVKRKEDADILEAFSEVLLRLLLCSLIFRFTLLGSYCACKHKVRR